MSKLHRFTGYICDVNDDCETLQNQIDEINRRKYGGNLEIFHGDTVDIDWDDDIDINKIGCTQATYDKYFDGGMITSTEKQLHVKRDIGEAFYKYGMKHLEPATELQQKKHLQDLIEELKMILEGF